MIDLMVRYWMDGWMDGWMDLYALIIDLIHNAYLSYYSIKNISQFYCCDNRYAIPCSKEVPYGFSCLPFCICFPKVACCISVASLYGDAGDHQG